MLFQVAVCRLPSDGGEQCDQSGLAAPHPAGVSAGSHHRSTEDSEHPLPPGSEVGTQTEAHTYINLKHTVDQLFVMQAFLTLRLVFFCRTAYRCGVWIHFILRIFHSPSSKYLLLYAETAVVGIFVLQIYLSYR